MMSQQYFDFISSHNHVKNRSRNADIYILDYRIMEAFRPSFIVGFKFFNKRQGIAK